MMEYTFPDEFTSNYNFVNDFTDDFTPSNDFDDVFPYLLESHEPGIWQIKLRRTNPWYL